MLRYWLQTGTFVFYCFTLGLGPLTLGYVCGRWMPVWIRALPLCIILSAGVMWTLHGDHWFALYAGGNLLYAYACARGLAQRAKRGQIAFWKLYHFDWLTVIAATVLMSLVYAWR